MPQNTKIMKDYCENSHTNRKVYIILKHEISQQENMKNRKPSQINNNREIEAIMNKFL